MGSTAQNEKLILPQINMGSSMQLSFDFAANYKTLSSGALKLTVKASLDKGQNWTEIWNAKDHMGTIDENNTPEDVTGKAALPFRPTIARPVHSLPLCLKTQGETVPAQPLTTWILQRVPPRHRSSAMASLFLRWSTAL